MELQLGLHGNLGGTFMGAGSASDDILYIGSFLVYDWIKRSTTRVKLDSVYISPLVNGSSYTLKAKLKSDDLINIKFGFGNMDTTITSTATTAWYQFTDTYTFAIGDSLFIEPQAVGIIEVDSVSFIAPASVIDIKLYGQDLDYFNTIYGIPVENLKSVMGLEWNTF